MSRRYYKVGPAFWSDTQTWSDDAKLLGLYVLTSPHRTTEGLFRMPKQYAMADLGWSAEQFAEPFAELLRVGFIEYDETASVCLIVNALKWQAPDNVNQAKSAVKALTDLPDTPLKTRFLSQAQRFSERLVEALPEGFGEGFTEGNGNPPTPTPAPSQTTALSGKPDIAQIDSARSRIRRDREQQVFDAWVDATGKTGRVVFDDKRRRVVRKALEVLDFPLEDCVDAVRGWRHSPHHRGENERATVYNDIELLLRDAKHIEMFRDLERAAGGGPAGAPSPGPREPDPMDGLGDVA